MELICSINSNPLPNEIVWKLNGNTIYEQVNKGKDLLINQKKND